MATTGFWPVKGNLKSVIVYAENPNKTMNPKFFDSDLYATLQYAENSNKTDQELFVSGINCSKHNAYAQMVAVKKKFGERGSVVAYHGYQSFKENEVTPEECHEIGIETARKMWGDKYQVIVTTHLDKKHHLHNHFVVNSTSFKDGLKFRNKIGDHYELRKISDAICAARNKSVIQCHKFYSNKKEYWIRHSGKLSHRDILRRDVDEAIANSGSFKEIEYCMKNLGYYNGKYDEIEKLSENIGKLYLVAQANARAIMENSQANAEMASAEVSRNLSTIDEAHESLRELRANITKTSEDFVSEVDKLISSLNTTREQIATNTETAESAKNEFEEIYESIVG